MSDALPTLIKTNAVASTTAVESVPSTSSWTGQLMEHATRAALDYSTALVVSSAIAIAAAAKKFREDRERRRISLEILPPRERRRIQDLLAQAAVLTGADRVVLGVFHNGSISFDGLHFTHLAIPFCYEHPSMAALPEFLRDIPVSSIMRELEAIWKNPGNEFIARASESTDSCRYYLETRGIEQLVFRSKGFKGFDVVIMGYHWVDSAPWTEKEREAVNRIEEEIIQIVRLGGTHRVLIPRLGTRSK